MSSVEAVAREPSPLVPVHPVISKQTTVSETARPPSVVAVDDGSKFARTMRTVPVDSFVCESVGSRSFVQVGDTMVKLEVPENDPRFRELYCCSFDDLTKLIQLSCLRVMESYHPFGCQSSKISRYYPFPIGGESVKFSVPRYDPRFFGLYRIMFDKFGVPQKPLDELKKSNYLVSPEWFDFFKWTFFRPPPNKCSNWKFVDPPNFRAGNDHSASDTVTSPQQPSTQQSQTGRLEHSVDKQLPVKRNGRNVLPRATTACASSSSAKRKADAAATADDGDAPESDTAASQPVAKKKKTDKPNESIDVSDLIAATATGQRQTAANASSGKTKQSTTAHHQPRDQSRVNSDAADSGATIDHAKATTKATTTRITAVEASAEAAPVASPDGDNLSDFEHVYLTRGSSDFYRAVRRRNVCTVAWGTIGGDTYNVNMVRHVFFFFFFFVLTMPSMC
jgi:hypothetical protein